MYEEKGIWIGFIVKSRIGLVSMISAEDTRIICFGYFSIRFWISNSSWILLPQRSNLNVRELIASFVLTRPHTLNISKEKHRNLWWTHWEMRMLGRQETKYNVVVVKNYLSSLWYSIHQSHDYWFFLHFWISILYIACKIIARPSPI